MCASKTLEEESETTRETEEAAETQLEDDEVETQFKLPVHPVYLSPVRVLVSFQSVCPW